VIAASLFGLAPLPASAADTLRLAISIGNNSPEREGPVLMYADDDALAMHELLVQNGVHSRCFTTPDRDTSARGAGSGAAPATLRAVHAAILEARAAVLAARAHGQASELYFYYSGHGDVDRGEGYVLLEDARLTRSALADLLQEVDADRNHVIVDACKSYFLAFERDPGGERQPYTAGLPTLAAPARLNNTGFILSTNAARPSHEWERFESGVFSHEVLSALRGAADADMDGSITYAELGAFVATANLRLPSRYRPDVLVVGPRRALDAPVLRWSSGPSLMLDATFGHAYVEGPSGERILDFHVPAGQRLALRLPAERPLYVQRADGSAEYVIDAQNVLTRSAATTAAAPQREKGPANLAFETLFVSPFSLQSVAFFRALMARVEESATQVDMLLHQPARQLPRDPLTPYVIGTGVAAVVALLIANFTNVGALLEANRVQKQCQACSPERLHDEQRLGRTLNQVALGSLIAGGVFGVTSGTLFAISLGKDQPSAEGDRTWPAR
jgi:hypothetical protein